MKTIMKIIKIKIKKKKINPKIGKKKMIKILMRMKKMTINF